MDYEEDQSRNISNKPIPNNISKKEKIKRIIEKSPHLDKKVLNQYNNDYLKKLESIGPDLKNKWINDSTNVIIVTSNIYRSRPIINDLNVFLYGFIFRNNPKNFKLGEWIIFSEKQSFLIDYTTNCTNDNEPRYFGIDSKYIFKISTYLEIDNKELQRLTKQNVNKEDIVNIKKDEFENKHFDKIVESSRTSYNHNPDLIKSYLKKLYAICKAEQVIFSLSKNENEYEKICKGFKNVLWIIDKSYIGHKSYNKNHICENVSSKYNINCRILKSALGSYFSSYGKIKI